MKAKDAERMFREFIAGRGVELSAITPARGVELMVEFYGEVRAEGCDLEQDGDMLLCLWGVHDSGPGPRFEVDITRQLIEAPGENEDVWQLSLRFGFAPDGACARFGQGTEWCPEPSEGDQFLSAVLASPVFRAMGGRRDGAVELRYG